MERKTILVADDEAIIGSFVKQVLERAGYNVLLANDAAGAMALYEKHQAEVALLLTDVIMPDISGLALADWVLACEPTARILLMSGSNLRESRGHGCLQKPFRAAQLTERVAEVFRCRELELG
jgi:two-component system cell cycle sensor histidine kinase/response regulator CckA